MVSPILSQFGRTVTRMVVAYLLVGVPCAGKSWVCNQLRTQFEYVSHDEHIGGDYIAAIRERAATTTKPLLIETPFSMSQIMAPLHDFDVTPLFIVEDVSELERRYREREGKPLPNGHATRQQTYATRAGTLGAFVGDSSQTLKHLRLTAARALAQKLV